MKKQPKKLEIEDGALKSNFADTDAYDRRIKRFVPYYDEMMNSVLDCLPELESHLVVLELGCGTGNLSQKLLNKSRYFKLVAIDITKEMVEKCRVRLAQYTNRTEIICADMIKFRRISTFDYVLSNLALHYPETDKKKISVCRNVYQSLRPGGIYSFSVMLTSDSPQSTEKIWKRWERDVLQNGITREELDNWNKTHHGSDHPVPPSLWLKWLQEVGFEYCELVWCETIFGTIRAKKPMA
jgi:SAM-dependent methyltransferase